MSRRYTKRGWRAAPVVLALLALVLVGCAQPGTGNDLTATPVQAAPTETPAAVEATATPAEVQATATPAEAEVTATPTAVQAVATPIALPEVQIPMQNAAFIPSEMTVSAGTTIIWTNQDSYAHTVTAGPRGDPSGLFDGSVPAGQSFQFTFEEPGTYNYYCRLHPGMDGVIVVE